MRTTLSLDSIQLHAEIFLTEVEFDCQTQLATNGDGSDRGDECLRSGRVMLTDTQRAEIIQQVIEAIEGHCEEKLDEMVREGT